MLNNVAAIIDAWRAGDVPDVTEVLSRHPEISPADSVIFDLVHEELLLRQERGLRFDSSCLRKRFPDHYRAVEEFIACQRALAETGDLLCDSAFPCLDARTDWPRPGDDWSGLHLVQTLATTATSAIFLARDQHMGGRFVTLKLSQANSDEPRLQGPLSHPGIMPIHSVQQPETPGPRGTVMPYWGQATLSDLIHSIWATRSLPRSPDCLSNFATQACGIFSPDSPPGAPIPTPASFADLVLDVGRQIGEALAHSHDRNIIHCDIKPANILTTPSGRVVLLDFSLSQRPSESECYVGGTIPYMSPERIESLLVESAAHDSARVDPRDDLFALGVTLFELLTGQLPFPPPSPQSPLREQLEQMRQHQKLPLAAPGSSSVASQLVHGLCRRLLDTTETGFKSVQQFLVEVEQVRTVLRQNARSNDKQRPTLRRLSLALATCVCLLISKVAFDGAETLPLTKIETQHATIQGPRTAFTQLLVWLDPRNEIRWVALGNHFLSHGLIDLGMQSYSHAESLDGDCYSALNNRALAAWKKGDVDQAEELFEKAIQSSPGQMEAYFNRGSLRRERLVQAVENRQVRRGSLAHARSLRLLSEDLRVAESLAAKSESTWPELLALRAWVTQQTNLVSGDPSVLE